VESRQINTPQRNPFPLWTGEGRDEGGLESPHSRAPPPDARIAECRGQLALSIFKHKRFRAENTMSVSVAVSKKSMIKQWSTQKAGFKKIAGGDRLRFCSPRTPKPLALQTLQPHFHGSRRSRHRLLGHAKYRTLTTLSIPARSGRISGLPKPAFPSTIAATDPAWPCPTSTRIHPPGLT
jgi:hypothetical protein